MLFGGAVFNAVNLAPGGDYAAASPVTENDVSHRLAELSRGVPPPRGGWTQPAPPATPALRAEALGEAVHSLAGDSLVGGEWSSPARRSASARGGDRSCDRAQCDLGVRSGVSRRPIGREATLAASDDRPGTPGRSVAGHRRDPAGTRRSCGAAAGRSDQRRPQPHRLTCPRLLAAARRSPALLHSPSRHADPRAH